MTDKKKITHWFVGDSVLCRYGRTGAEGAIVRVFADHEIEWDSFTEHTYVVQERNADYDILRQERVVGLEAAMALGVEWIP